MLLALGSHTGWGVYPVLARHLQAVSGLPGMAMLTVGNLLCLTLVGAAVWRRGELAMLRTPALWGVATLAMLRSITNVASARYTLAIYVQLINLLTPFLVVTLGTLFFRERVPRATWPALGLTLAGALLVLSPELAALRGVSLGAPADTWLGIGLALISTLALALYMLAVRATRTHPVSAEATFAVQILVLVATTGPLSLLLGEDWGRWGTLGPRDWLLFLIFALAIVLGANQGQIAALRHLGAPLVSSMQPWRLVAALVAGGLLLGEWLTTPWQLAGALIVVATVSWYLWRQRPARR